MNSEHRLCMEEPVKNVIVNVMLLGALVVGFGCAGQGEAVPIALALKPSNEKTAVSSSGIVNVLVILFGDDRSDRTKLGVHQSLWGTTEPLTPKNGMT